MTETERKQDIEDALAEYSKAHRAYREAKKALNAAREEAERTSNVYTAALTKYRQAEKDEEEAQRNQQCALTDLNTLLEQEI